MKKGKINKAERVLVMAHAHPDFSLGGGEIAAYNLYKAYLKNPNVEDAWFLARADKGRGANGHISLRRKGEYLWEQAVHDWHFMRAVHRDSVTSRFRDLLGALDPTIVHTHHYAHLGLEYLRVIKQLNSSIKLVLTLHEYMAICANNGQMVKTSSFKLCSRASPDDCRLCYPTKTAEDFWLRKHFFMSHFELVDQFISPSEFLRQRYIAWGLPAEKIAVIENGQSDELPLAPRPLSRGETRSRFGFFGQINPFKGLDVLLQAITEIPKTERQSIVLEVHGANLEHQPKEFQERVEALRRLLMQEGVVQWVGPYQPHELRQRMSNVDWVVVPSIWWENSPMVIQEASVLKKPLLVSEIGGMREKVDHMVSGIHLPVGNPKAISQVIQSCASKTDEYLRFVKNIKTPINYYECASAHIGLITST